MPRTLTAQDEHASQVWLAAIDAGLASTATIAEIVGLTQRQVRNRVASARRNPYPVDFSQEADHEVRPTADPVHLEVIHRRPLPVEERPGGWYALADDSTSQDGRGGIVSIVDGDGRRVLRLPLRGGFVTLQPGEGHAEPEKAKERTKGERHHVPAKEKPGLKGGRS